MSRGNLVPKVVRQTAWWVFAGALLWQLLVLVLFSDSPHFLPSSDDMKFYSDWGSRIAKGTLSDGQAFYGLPGYAYALGGLYAIVGFDPFLVGGIQAVFFAATASLILVITWRACEQRMDIASSGDRSLAMGIIAAIGWILFVPAQVFAVILMPTVPVVFAYWLCVLIFMAPPAGNERHWKWFALGTFIGAVAMVVATILFAVPMALVAIFRSYFKVEGLKLRSVKMAIAALLLAAGLILGASPAWIHNYYHAREPVLLSAHSGLNMWIGNNPGANGYPKIPPGLRASQEGLLKDSITLAQTATGKPLKRYEVSRYWAEKANSWIRENRSQWLRLLYVKFENFWNAFQYDDLSTIRLLQTANVVPFGIRFGLISALGLPGLCLMAWRLPQGRWILAAVLLHMLAVMSVFVTERYRLAAVPGLLIGMSFTLVCLYQWLSTAMWRQAAAFVLAGAATVYFVTLPRNDPGFWSLDHYKAGIRSLELGEMEAARRELETAYAYTPGNAEINFALGNYWFTEKDFDRAKRFYRAALHLDPRHAGVFNNLGVIMIEERRWDWAEKLLMRAASIDPEDAKRYYLLARVQMESGNIKKADDSIGEALRLKPNQAEFVELQQRIRSFQLPR